MPTRRTGPKLALDIRRRRSGGARTQTFKYVTVRNLTTETDYPTLRSLFGSFGQLTNIELMVDPQSCNPATGMALITYRNPHHAKTAVSYLHGFPVNGNFISAKNGPKWTS